MFAKLEVLIQQERCFRNSIYLKAPCVASGEAAMGSHPVIVAEGVDLPRRSLEACRRHCRTSSAYLLILLVYAWCYLRLSWMYW